MKFKQGVCVLKLYNILVYFILLGLNVCTSEDKELRDKLLRLKLEALVRSEGEQAASQALETFSQVF